VITVTAIAISTFWFKRSMTRHGVLAARAIPARVGVSA